MAGAERYVRGGPVGVAVPVIYQRADGSAHVIVAVHAGDGDGVDLLDPQKGEEAEAADVVAATGMWVIPVPGAEVEGRWCCRPVVPGCGARAGGWVARRGGGAETSARCVRAGGEKSRRECGEFAGG
ncbi:hypothetical protein [Saccharopolyspora spinosa]|uniref:hypothetical protein n=1 Tax=Saccharopolyspora spinosa TaxID=60894 RepID=UPI00376F08F2